MNRLEDINPNFWDNDGKPLAEGAIEVWDDQTKQRLLPLHSIGGGTLENPVPIESSGRTATPVYFDTNKAYIAVKDKGGAVIKEFEYGVSTSVQGDMNVKGDIISERNLEAKGNVIAQNDLVAHKDLIVDGNATIKGNTNTKDLHADGNLSVSSKTTTETLKVNGDAQIEGELEANLLLSHKIRTEEIIVLRDNNLEKGGITARRIDAHEIHVMDKITGSGATVTIDDDLKVNQSATIMKNLDVDGKLTANDISMPGSVIAVAPTTQIANAEMPVGSYIFVLIFTNSNNNIAFNSQVDTGREGTWLCSGSMYSSYNGGGLENPIHSHYALCRRVS